MTNILSWATRKNKNRLMLLLKVHSHALQSSYSRKYLYPYLHDSDIQVPASEPYRYVTILPRLRQRVQVDATMVASGSFLITWSL